MSVPHDSSTSLDPEPETTTSWSWKRTVFSFIVVALFVAAVVALRKHPSFEQLARYEESMREFEGEHPVVVYAGAIAIYVVITGLSIPVASILTLLYGWYFGFWRALILVSFSATAGATVAFLVSRYLFRGVLERRFGELVKRCDNAIQRDGAFYLFALRLTPVVPYWVINAVMGLTRLRIRTFWWVSQVGMLPNIAVYVYAGASAPDLRTLAKHGLAGLPIGRLLFAFFLIGCFPLIARRIVRRFRREPT